MAINLTLNGTSLQTSNYVVSRIGHDSAPGQQLSLQSVSRRDGEKLVSANYKTKSITLVGTIKGTSLANLETNIDAFKLLCAVTDGRLDIEYAGTVRRFVVSMDSIAIERDHYHITFAPFSVSFQVYDPPFGMNVSALGGNLAFNEALSSDNQAVQAISSTVSFDGTAPPRPLTTFRIDNARNLDTIVEQVIGKKNVITIGTAFTAGDVLVIDHDNQVVLWNGRSINFDGVFPEYDIGSNTVVSTFTEGTAAVDQSQVTVDELLTVNENTHHIFQGFQVSATDTYFQVELYMRRDINTRSGTLTFDIRNASGDNPGPTQVTNSSVTVNVTDVPVDGGWIRFKFATNPTLSVSTDYRLVVVPASLDGNIYYGLARGNPYSNGKYGFSLNNGTTWRSDSVRDLAFRVWKTTSAITWSVGKKIEYVKRYL